MCVSISSNIMDEDETTNQQQIFDNFAKIKEATGTTNDTNREKIAITTAVLIQQEIQRWKLSIAQLEAALVDQPQRHPVPPPLPANVIFPIIPAVVEWTTNEDVTSSRTTELNYDTIELEEEEGMALR